MPEKPRDKLLVLTLFKTGGRLEEVLSLKPSNFDFASSNLSIVVRDMPVEKKWAYTDETHTTTKKLDVRRTFPVILAEEMSAEFKVMLEEVSKEKDKPIFAGWDSKRAISRNMGYKTVAYQTGKWPHFFRGQRASQLSDDYEFDTPSLNAYFGWSKSNKNTSERYATISWRGLERRMLLAMKMRRELEAEYSPRTP